MVYVKLACVYWVESTLLTTILLMDCVWVDEFVVGFLIDSLALVFTVEANAFGITHLNLSRTTD
jgi:hypothetical protein